MGMVTVTRYSKSRYSPLTRATCLSGFKDPAFKTYRAANFAYTSGLSGNFAWTIAALAPQKEAYVAVYCALKRSAV